MEQRHDKSQSGLNGFFLGVIVGIALALLFTTKKGRQILRTLADEGISRLEVWERQFEKKVSSADVVDDEDTTDEPYVKTLPIPEKTLEQVFHEKVLEKHEHDHESNGPQTVAKVKPAPRRLFRGIPKRN